MSFRLVSSESVTSGHPDKLADQISDAILDAYLEKDSDARVAVETFATGNIIHVGGEVRSKALVDVEKVVRQTILNVGYNHKSTSLDGRECSVMVSINPQSPEIAAGVDTSLENRRTLADTELDPLDAQGAGDQGIMFGYASNETHQYMPAPITLAHALTTRLTELRAYPDTHLLPDGKAQVTIGYRDGKPETIETVLISTQHTDHYSSLEGKLALQELITERVIKHVILQFNRDNESHCNLIDKGNYIINPSGSFIVGGPKADAGLTGRKIIVDTYGGAAKHGGGAFSGKDPSKVDRSAAYALRWIAKNVVAAGIAARAEIQVAYAIGKAHPVGIYVDTFGTSSFSDEAISRAITQVFDLRPLAIIRDLELTTTPKYLQTASGGHFGRGDNPDFTWERVNRLYELAEAMSDATGIPGALSSHGAYL